MLFFNCLKTYSFNPKKVCLVPLPRRYCLIHRCWSCRPSCQPCSLPDPASHPASHSWTQWALWFSRRVDRSSPWLCLALWRSLRLWFGMIPLPPAIDLRSGVPLRYSGRQRGRLIDHCSQSHLSTAAVIEVLGFLPASSRGRGGGTTGLDAL